MASPSTQNTEKKKTFKALGLAPWLCKTCEATKFFEPTPIQAMCIPSILKGNDVIGAAVTGSGKTAAFALPMLHKLSQDPFGIYGVVLTPTRELAFQISEQFAQLGAHMKARTCVIVGGVDMMKQSKELANRPHFVVATPGRLRDHFTSNVDLKKVCSRVQFVVMDEADRLLESSFKADLEEVFEALPTRRQTLLFSATMTDNMSKLERLSMREPLRFDISPKYSTVANLKQEYMFIPQSVKECYLVYLLKKVPTKSNTVVFTGKCYTTQLIMEILRILEIDSVCLHSEMSQQKRMSSVAKFKSRISRVLVCTDVASRGLDIPSVDFVINFDVPSVAKDYVHRVGRTARAGRGGQSITLVTQYDVERVLAIEEKIEKKLGEYEHKESEVLEELKAVSLAKKTAENRLEENGFGEKRKKRREKNGGPTEKKKRKIGD